MANLSIKSKLLTMLLATSVFSIAIVASLNYYACYQTLKGAVFSDLTSLRASRADQIEQFIERLRLEVRVVGASGTVVDASRSFIAAFRELDTVAADAERDAALRRYYERDFLPALAKATGNEPEIGSLLPESAVARYLQFEYIANNPFPTGHKSEMTRAADASDYSRAHEQFHRPLKRVFDALGFIDAYIIDIETGSIVYSLHKEPDFATRLTDGVYSHTNLANLFRALQRAPDRDAVQFVDFQSYRASLGVPSSFVGTPVFDGGKPIAVLALQLPVDQIERVMTGGHQWERDGLGKTGETYLVGPDLLLRSNPRFLIEAPDAYARQMKGLGVSDADIATILREKSAILHQRIRSHAAEQALHGNQGTGVFPDYRGVDSLLSWEPLQLDGLQWGIVAKIDRDEAFAPMAHLARDTLIQTLVILLVITLAVMFIATSFVKPVNDLIARVRLARTGKTDLGFAADTTDEIGDLSRSFRELIDSVQKQTRMLEDVTRENQQLLENVMPKAMAERVRIGNGEITERIDDVTVVFAELHGLAEHTHATSDNESIVALKQLIAAFDETATRFGVERIKTVGDTYLAVTGLSQPLLDHMRRSVEFARAARGIVAEFNSEKSAHLGVVVGIASGPVVADVAGRGRFFFQLWGAAVIDADHAMDSGNIGDIVVTRSVRDGLSDQYAFEPLSTATSGVPLWTLAEHD